MKKNEQRASGLIKKGICLLVFLKLTAIHAQQETSSVKEYLKVFPTYPFSDPSPIPMAAPVYPYFRFDGFATKAIDQQWKVVELENNYIRLLILPEIGGKIWAAIEKSTDRSFLYYNHAVKFRDIAMRGPWTSGGLEANYGIIGHTPNCATPVDYITVQNEDGSVSCYIGALDLLSRSYWRMEINLPKDKAYFTTRSFWYNTMPLTQPYYHWMNAGLKVSDDLEFIYAGNKFLGHAGEYGDWPVNKKNNKLISWYRNNDFSGYKSYHVFGRYTDFTGAYWHKDDFGMVRYGSHDDKPGKKLWIWGLSRQGMIWEKLLSDTDGQYFELQSGRLFNQNIEKSSLTPFKHIGLTPYATETWKEYWYPVLGTKGIVYANPYGALNVRVDKELLKISFSPAQKIEDTIYIRSGQQVIYKKMIHAVPLQLFSDSVSTTLRTDSLQIILGNHLMNYTSYPEADSLSRPVDFPKDFDWESVYGLYMRARESVDMKNYAEAEAFYSKALGKDPYYLPALVGLAEILYRNMRYTEALELAKKALAVNSVDGDANYIYGLVNEQIAKETDARDGFDLAALNTANRGAACTELAKMYLRRQEYDRAIDYTIKALVVNQYNMEALELQAVVYRLMHNEKKAMDVVATIAHYDPLNHFARFEKYLWSPTTTNKNLFLSGIHAEMPSEIIMETALWYYRLGLKKDALDVFTARPGSAEISIWIDYLQGKPFRYEGINPVRAFPFRSETAEMLEYMRKTSSHWFLSYQLALIYRDKNRLQECRSLLQDAGDSPDFAPVYAFRASLYDEGDSLLMLKDLKRAVALDPQWRYQKLLAEYFIQHGQYPEALNISSRFYAAHPDQYIMGMLYAKTLLLNREYEKCDQLLGKLEIIPFEGATTGREMYREAKLMQAVGQMKKKKWKEAIEFINQAGRWPENLGVGEPYKENEDSRLEEWMRYRCMLQLNQSEEAKGSLKKITAFVPVMDNTVPNYIPVNALVSAWAYRILGDTAKAVTVLSDKSQEGNSPALQNWMKAAYFQGKDQPLLSVEDANTRILKAILENSLD